jgi:hypothetical protein
VDEVGWLFLGLSPKLLKQKCTDVQLRCALQLMDSTDRRLQRIAFFVRVRCQMPPSYDPLNPDAIGASEEGLRRASLAIRWVAVAAIATAIVFFYVLFPSP